MGGISDEARTEERGQAVGVAERSQGGLAVAEAAKPVWDKDEKGRFVSGNIGGGRPPGSRNKLTEDFLADFHDAWKEHGAAALRKMAVEEPAAFVQAGVKLMPRDVLLEARGAGLVVVKMSDEDLAL